MRTHAQWLREWVRESKRVLPLLEQWRDALVRRDLARIDQLNAQLLPLVERLEQTRHTLNELASPSDLPAELLQQALQVAQQIDQIAQVAYDVILDELDYTHGLMAILVRTSEPEHYAPCGEPPKSPTLLINAEA
ncbi:MAG: hypothetical protein RMJ83_05720 [Armatimonadota bacterium]|nr:hypothetical protein [Armatimonadota bacterium]